MDSSGAYIDLHTHLPKPRSGVYSLYNYIVKDGAEPLPAHDFSAGIHPWYISAGTGQEERLRSMAALPRCRAIGETGLDRACGIPAALQEKTFVAQCRLARTLNKPMVLHVVKAHFETMDLLKAEGIRTAVFHGYNNRYTILEKIIANGFFVSMGAALLNGQSPASALVAQVPAAQLFLETDDSQYTIEDIYAAAAHKRQTDVAQLKEQLAQNLKHFFA